MTMIKALIIDNDAFVREDIREKVMDYFDKDIVISAEAEGVVTGLAAIEAHQPDLLFLDINMEDGTGFDLLNRCAKKNFDIVFITGYDEHAIKAIKVGALDYILKPVDDQEFKQAVQKAIDNYKKENHIEKLVEISSDYYRGAEKKRVILKTVDNVYAIYEDDIIYCRSEGNYTTFYTQQMEKIMVSKFLKQVEEILTESVFIRCHQSYIVNKKHVQRYNKQGVLIVHLDFKVPVSSRRKDYVLKRIFD